MKIRHATPGRVRIQIDQIRSQENKGRQLSGWLRNQPALKQAEVRPVTGSVILYFKPGSLTTAGLLSLVHEGLQDIGRLAPKAAGTAEGLGVPVRPESRPDGNMFLSGLTWFIGVTIVLAGALVSEFLLKIPVTVFSPVGAAAVFGAVPLLAASIREIRRKQGFTLLPFLAGTCLLALGVGEVLTALEVIWVTASAD